MVSQFSSLDIDDVRNQMYEIMGLLIDRLQMIRLWGYGFPDIPLFVFVLRKYLELLSILLFI